MATQYTDILKLALPTQGELIGTWGNVVNTEITTLIEQAIAGMVTINTWTTNSHTLTVIEGAVSESRAAILKLTDTNTQLNDSATVICPNATKLYIVDNQTGRTAVIKTAAGTGVTVPTGRIAFVFCDGVGVKRADTTESAANVSYSNGASGLTATNVQAAIDEVSASVPSIPGAVGITYDNTVSGLTATNVQAAIDEVDAKVDINTANIATNTANIATNAGNITALQAKDDVFVGTANATATVTKQAVLMDLTNDAAVDVTITLNDATFAANDLVRIRKTNRTGVFTLITTNNQVLPDGATATNNFVPTNTAATVEVHYTGTVWNLRVY